jgi:hypothetical protein
MDPIFVKEWEYDMRLFIAVAEACHRKDNPSYSWHVLERMSWINRFKYPLVRKCDQIIDLNGLVT